MSLSRPWLALVLALFCLPLFVGLGRADIENDEAIYSFGGRSHPRDPATGSRPRAAPRGRRVPRKAAAQVLDSRRADPIRPAAARRVRHALLGRAVWRRWHSSTFSPSVSRLAGPVCGAVAALVLFVHPPLLFRARPADQQHGSGAAAGVLRRRCYHFLRWAEAAGPGIAAGPRRGGQDCTSSLGFMTKFVAGAVFADGARPGDAGVHRRARGGCVRDWRLWGGGGRSSIAALMPAVVRLCADQRFGRLLWETMLRSSTSTTGSPRSLDPAHVQPVELLFPGEHVSIASASRGR